jgi:hypothetical protein
MSAETVNLFLKDMADTATSMDLDAHLDLISRRVQLLGVPGFDVINYDDWAAQCQHEFSVGLIKSVSYQGMKMITDSDSSIMFQTIEATDNTCNVMGIEVILEKEKDGKWRITQERVLAEDEPEHDKRNGLL